MSDPERKPLLWIVDDSSNERAAARRALAADYTFEEFTDGTEVIERLERTSTPPTLILLDWVMPNLGGDEVCRYVRGHQMFADLPIVLFTASRIETEDIVQGLSLGANDYVPKPFAAEELRARVHAVLRSKEHRDAASRERTRLAAINRLGSALFSAADIPSILNELLRSLHGLVADGCAIILLPGELSPITAAVHRGDPDAKMLSSIATLTDPTTFAFASSEEALAKLPPLYHPYIQKFGLRGLAILPFPIRTPIQGVVTLTRDGSSQPFDPDDLATIETCIEYASLAVQNAIRFQAERDARAQLHAVIDHAPIGIVVADAAGTVQIVNSSAARLIDGIERGQTLDAVFSLGSWASTTGVPMMRAAWPFGRTGNTALRAQVKFTAPGREPRVLSLTTVTPREVDELVGTVTVIEDVTAQHAIGEERERVAAFQEQMLGIVGHDLRNPLSAIVTGSEIILEYAREMPKIQSTVARIQSSSRRMTSIVGQLLDVTRARLGDGIPLVATKVSLAALLGAVLEEARAAFPKSTFEVRTADVTGIWDPDRLSQVFSNLVGNAVQYGDNSKPIRIAVTVEADRAIITVSNALRDGPIPAERLAVLFEPYVRGEGSSIAHRTGLGLGLYISHEIVVAHKGRISAASSPEGTVFTIELPLSTE